MKVHTVMKYHVGVPMVVQLTSAAKHDHYLLKEVRRKSLRLNVIDLTVCGLPILSLSHFYEPCR